MFKSKSMISPWNVLVNLTLVYICYIVCRLAFILENWNLFKADITFGSFWKTMKGGFIFDSSAICYTNAMYILLVLFPLHFKECKIFNNVTKWLFITVNLICIAANLIDAVYFSYTQHRATAIIFDEFSNENNLGAILGVELARHWYFVLLLLLLVLGMTVFYRHPKAVNTSKPIWKYYLRQSISLAFAAALSICGMRGDIFTTASRPIAVSNAHQYVNNPTETGIVLNTPFAMIRTYNKSSLNIPIYFKDKAQLDSIYTPVHYPIGDIRPRKKNVVILIVESFAQEFLGSLNKSLDNGNYKGYTPFADSLIQHSLTFEESFSNSGFSIDAMPAVLASIPRMDNPFVLTPYSLNKVTSIASELNRWGYYTAFFHGAENNSMGFQAFARAIGFKDYFGRTEYNQCPKFDGDKDFDGTWAIWDEPFLQYFCYEMGKMKEPFLTTVFTATSHHPFAIPEKYKNVFKDEGIHLIHKCVRYTDYSLRQFFRTASKQPWYKNTIFVITADHASSKTTHDEYKTVLGHFRIPILFYDPSGEMLSGCHAGIAQQIDIMPTILGYLGYDKPYIAFGKDLMHTPSAETWAFNWDHLPQFIKGDYLLQSDGEKITAAYNYRKDKLLKHNIKGHVVDEKAMELQMKAIMQSYMERMKADSVYIK